MKRMVSIGVAVFVLISGISVVSLQDNTFESMNDADVSTTAFEGVETCCTDGIDNDGNGLVDNEGGDCWIREGATFCEELIWKTDTFNELNDMIPILKDTGVNLIELAPIWIHCNSLEPGFRWQVRDYEKLDPARGTEEELSNFLNNAHAEGLKVITMFETATTTPPSPVCDGRVASWAPGIDYDGEGLGGYLYQYQIANMEKDILIKNFEGEYACEFGGHGLSVNPQSEDVIEIFKELYEREINERGFDGLRIDHPSISYCFSGDAIWRICERCLCPDPVAPGNYSPLRLYRTLRESRKSDQIFTSEDPCTNPWISDWACNYPHYHPSTNMDEVVEISEDYLFCKILRDYITTSIISSDEFVRWLNNEPVIHGRTRYRMWRNWNMFDRFTINFTINDPRYLPMVSILSTIPGVPKVTQWEIIEEPPIDVLNALNIKEIKFPVDVRRDHWKKVLNIRNNNNALKYGSIENVWKSGDNTYICLREYEDEKVIVAINFLDKQAISTLNLSFLENGTILYDGLNNETFVVSDPPNFEISIPAYGSRILFLKEGDEPIIYIEKPEDRYLYIFDKEILPTISGNTIILGKITIKADAFDENGIEKVEFYINDVLKSNDDVEPYLWLWNEYAVGNHEIKVVAYDNASNIASDDITIWKLF